jgi:uncharacterized coiled-coil protein SlyX
MKTFIEREVLLQVKRIYSKDEIIAELNRQLKESNFKVGVLESQVAELEDEIKILKKPNVINKHDEYLKTILKQFDDLKIRNRENKRKRQEWMGKYYQVLNQNNQL